MNMRGTWDDYFHLLNLKIGQYIVKQVCAILFRLAISEF